MNIELYLMGSLNGLPESGIAALTAPFEKKKKDEFACLYRGCRVLQVHVILTDPANCTYDNVRASSKASFASWTPPNGINAFS